MIRLNKAAAQAGVTHRPVGGTVIGRAEMIANTTGNLIMKIVWLNLYNLAAQQIGEARIDGHGL